MHNESKQELVQDISSQIEAAGGLTFADYMGQALYHPTHGYYTAPPRNRIGKQGDFFYLVKCTSLFWPSRGSTTCTNVDFAWEQFICYC